MQVLLFKNHKISSRKILDEEFSFKFANLKDSIKDIIRWQFDIIFNIGSTFAMGISNDYNLLLKWAKKELKKLKSQKKKIL
jgi:hypothetical protein